MANAPLDTCPTHEHQKQFVYLTRVMNETMRICSPAGQIPFRMTSEATEIDGHVVPSKTLVLPFTYSIHHNAKGWKDPDRFAPDRFMSEQEWWMPFGSGSRSCIGQSFSLVEQRVVLGMLLRNYEFDII